MREFETQVTESNQRNTGPKSFEEARQASAAKAQEIFNTAVAMRDAFGKHVRVVAGTSEVIYRFYEFGQGETNLSNHSRRTRARSTSSGHRPQTETAQSSPHRKAAGEAWSSYKGDNGTITKGPGRYSASNTRVR